MAGDTPDDARRGHLRLAAEQGRDSAEFGLPERAEDLVDTHAPTREKIAAVRRAIYRGAPTGSRDTIVEPHHLSDYARIAENLREGENALWCAGAAFLMQRAVEALGFRAWVLHYGFSDDLTHAVTIVEIDGKRILEDAYLNRSCNLDVLDMLDQLQRGRRVLFSDETRDNKLHIVSDSRANAQEIAWLREHALEELEPNEKVRRFLLAAPTHFARATRGFSGRGMERLREAGLPPELPFLLLNPIGVFDGATFQADPEQMPLISEWIEQRGGEPLSRRSTVRRREDAPDTRALAARLQQERRAWLDERLNLLARVDREQFEARLAHARARELGPRIDALMEENAKLTSDLAAAEADARRAREAAPAAMEAFRARAAEQAQVLEAQASEAKRRYAEIEQNLLRTAERLEKAERANSEAARTRMLLDVEIAALVERVRRADAEIAAQLAARAEADARAEVLSAANADLSRELVVARDEAAFGTVAIAEEMRRLRAAADDITRETSALCTETTPLGRVRALVGRLHAAELRAKMLEASAVASRAEAERGQAELADARLILERSRYLKVRRALAHLFQSLSRKA